MRKCHYQNGTELWESATLLQWDRIVGKCHSIAIGQNCGKVPLYRNRTELWESATVSESASVSESLMVITCSRVRGKVVWTVSELELWKTALSYKDDGTVFTVERTFCLRIQVVWHVMLHHIRDDLNPWLRHSDNLKGRSFLLIVSLQMEAACSSRTFVSCCRTAQCCNWEDLILNTGNFQFHIAISSCEMNVCLAL